MQITISPIATAAGLPETQVSVSGDVITVDGTPFDLTAVPEGGEATPSGTHPFVGTITRTAGEIVCTVQFHYDPQLSSPIQPTDPASLTATVVSGPLPDLIARPAA